MGQHTVQVAATLSQLNLEFKKLFRPRLLALKYVRMWCQRLGFRAFYEKAKWVYRPRHSKVVLCQLKVNLLLVWSLDCVTLNVFRMCCRTHRDMKHVTI